MHGYLPLLMPLGTLRLQLCLAVRAIRQPMNDDMVRFRRLHQGASYVLGFGALPVALPPADAGHGSAQGSFAIAALVAHELLPWFHACHLLYYDQQNFSTAFLGRGRLGRYLLF